MIYEKMRSSHHIDTENTYQDREKKGFKGLILIVQNVSNYVPYFLYD